MRPALAGLFIESALSLQLTTDGYDFFVDFEQAGESIKLCAEALKQTCANVQLLSAAYGDIRHAVSLFISVVPCSSVLLSGTPLLSVSLGSQSSLLHSAYSFCGRSPLVFL